MQKDLADCFGIPSLPSRERGLKSFYLDEVLPGDTVAPFAGAWIEIEVYTTPKPGLVVAPFAGAWIEIQYPWLKKIVILSLPSRERGLKCLGDDISSLTLGRSLRGSVD